MQRLFRRVGKITSKQKNDFTSNGYEAKVNMKISTDISESKSCNALSSGARSSDLPSVGSVSEVNLSPKCQKKAQKCEKKRNSLIESFRIFKRSSKNPKGKGNPVDMMNDRKPSKLNEEIKIQGVLVCENEVTVDHQAPQTREMIVNVDEPSLSLSTTTLRSLGSAEACAVNYFAKPESIDAAESISGDIERADFLSREVPGYNPQAISQNEALRPETVDTRENHVSDQLVLVSSAVDLQGGRGQEDADMRILIDTEAGRGALSESSKRQSISHNTDEKNANSAIFSEIIFETLPVNLSIGDQNGCTPAGVTKNDISENIDLCSRQSVQKIANLSSQVGVLDSPPARPNRRKWSLMKELTRLSRYGWYWGPVTREEAEEKLTDQPEGSFLIRDSTDERYLFSLSFRSFNHTLHTRIEYCNGEFSFYHMPQSEGYGSLVDLIENAIRDSLNGIFYYSRSNTAGSHSYAVKLTKPVSRFTQVRSLQYLCRFIIRQHTRVDHIQNLPLPMSVKGWLGKNQY